MTLIFALQTGGAPAILSDLLVSTKTPLGSERYIPTIPPKHYGDVSSGKFLLGLQRKMHAIQDGPLLLASGNAVAIGAFFSQVENELPSHLSLKDRSKWLQSCLQSSYKDLGVIVADTEKGKYLISSWNARSYQSAHAHAEVIGSGRDDFGDWFHQEGSSLVAQGDKNTYVNAIKTTLSAAASYIFHQGFRQYGLSARWGGGFEVVAIDPDTGRFSPLDKVMFYFCTVYDRAPKATIANALCAMYSFYSGNDLIQMIVRYDRTVSVQRIKPLQAPELDAGAGEIEFEDEPDWLVVHGGVVRDGVEGADRFYFVLKKQQFESCKVSYTAGRALIEDLRARIIKNVNLSRPLNYP